MLAYEALSALRLASSFFWWCSDRESEFDTTRFLDISYGIGHQMWKAHWGERRGKGIITPRW
jgi:hypothetical protein